MSRAGRTLFFATILTSLLLNPLFIQVQRAHADAASYADCLKDLLVTVTQNSSKLDILNSLNAYNRMIQQPVKNFTNAALTKDFERAVNLLNPANPSFPKDEFLKWSKITPFSDAQLAAMKAEKQSLGDVLHERAKLFQSSKETVSFDQAIGELDSLLNDIKKLCGKDVACHEKEISKIVTKKGGLFSCLKANPDIYANAIKAFSVSTAGVLIRDLSKKDASLANQSYEIHANNMIWIPLLTEVGCRNTTKSVANRVGQPAATEVKKMSHLSNGLRFMGQQAKGWVSYMAWSPVNEATYMAFHLGAEHYIRGHDVDTSGKHLWKEFYGYLKWDAQFAVPRSLATDQLYNRALPNYLKPFLQNNMKTAGGAKTAYLGIDLALRTAINVANTTAFQKHEETGSFAFLWPFGKDEPTPTPAPGGTSVKPAEIKPASVKPVEIDTVKESPQWIPKPEIKNTQKKLSCKQLVEIYESCVEEKDLDHVNECDAKLTAYEKQCGSYFVGDTN